MTWLGSDVTLKNTRQLDGFLALRTSLKKVVFESANKYDGGPLLWDSVLTGTGTVTHSTTDGRTTLSTGGTASGAKAVKQSHQYLIYSPGQTRQMIAGFLFGAAVTNVRRRIGYFDDNNGVFFEQTSTGIRFVSRTNASGSPVDSTFEQSAWQDKFDGTGVSGKTLDITTSQAIVIEHTGYNAAFIRFGFFLDNEIYYALSISNPNSSTSFGIATSVVPVRIEVENTGTAAGTNTAVISSCVVYDENGESDDFSYMAGAARTTELAVTTRVPLISVRPKLTFGGIQNRAHVHLTSIIAVARTNNAILELVRGGTLTGPAWTSCGTNSVTEFDETATAITGGDVLYKDFVVAGSGSTANITKQQPDSQFGLFLSADGTTSDILTLVATSTTGTSNLFGAINVFEQR